MLSTRQVISAELTYVEGGFVPGVQVVVAEDGCIVEAGVLGYTPTMRLPGRALLPGFVSAHSHAFQRALRGRSEGGASRAGDFWNWREAMYALAERLTPDEFRSTCRETFAEMLAAGITSVGEFHYLHHADAAVRDFALDDLLVAAAADAGIRLALLVTYYHTAGIGREAAVLTPAQRRFDTPSVDAFWAQVDQLARRLDPRMQSLGVAAHSLRAAPPADVLALYREAAKRGLPFHMHVEEQPREMEEVRAAIGQTPLEWVLNHLPVNAASLFTAVHLTQSDPATVRRLLQAGGRVCICPSTEANLGDGLPDGTGWLPGAAGVCIGSDSNVRIDPFEELRWLEYGQRLRFRRRGVPSEEPGGVANWLLACGTLNGAAALGVNSGAIAVGRAADLIAVDLKHLALTGWTPETLADQLVFSGSAAVVREVCVGGVWRTPEVGA